MNWSSIYRIALVGVLALGTHSCELVELDSMPAPDAITGSDADPEMEDDEHVIPSSVPTDQDEIVQLLTNGNNKSWSAASFTLQGLEGFQQCRLDDVIVIDIDGSYVYDGGTELCGAEDNAIVRVGDWTLSSNGTSVTMDQGTSDEFTMQIIGLVEDRVALSAGYMGLEVIGVYETN